MLPLITFPVTNRKRAERVVGRSRGRYKVKLTKKFADFLDGIDLSRVKAGENIELNEREAQLLIAEGWALPTKPDASAGRPSRRPHKRPPKA